MFFVSILEGFYNVFYSLDVLSGFRRLFEVSMYVVKNYFFVVSLSESKVFYVMLESMVKFR